MRGSDQGDDDAPPKFDLSVAAPRKRVGIIRNVLPDKHFGFIEAEDFREDVFFHFNRFEPAKKGQQPLLEMPVEFELDEAHRKATGKFKASAVRPTNRPVARRLSGRDAPHLQVQHHPRSLRRRPDWRDKTQPNPGDSPGAEPPTSGFDDSSLE